MKFWCSVATACLALAGSSRLPAQAIGLEVDHVLANPAPLQMEVFAVLLGSDGWLWIGSGNGLARYDGYRAVPYRLEGAETAPGSDPAVRAIHEDLKRRLWLATPQGLVCLDPAEETAVRFRHSQDRNDTLADDDLSCLYAFPKHPDRFWIGSARGLDEFDAAAGRVVRHLALAAGPDGLNRVHCLSGDMTGNLWVGASSGLYRLGPSDRSLRLVRFPPFGDSANGAQVEAFYSDWKPLAVNAIYCSKEFPGAVWVGSQNAGLFRYLPARDLWQACAGTGPDSILSEARINAVNAFPGQPGCLLVGTEGGLMRYDPLSGAYAHLNLFFSEYDMQPSQCVRVIYRDRRESVWIGSCRNGLDKWSPVAKPFTRFSPYPDRRPDPLANWVTSVKEKGRNELLVTTYGGGVFVFDRRSAAFRRLLPDPSRPGRKLNSHISDAAIDADGTLWFMTAEGLAQCFADGRLRYLHRLAPGQGEIIAFAMIRAGSGYSWVGTDRGLFCIDSERRHVRHFRNRPGDPLSLSNDHVNSILEDASGALWVGTDDGLNFLPAGGADFSIFRNDPAAGDSLSGNTVTYLFQDGQGRIWACTANGLNLVRRNDGGLSFHRFVSPGDDARKNSFMSIVEEDDRHFWLGSKVGLARFDSQLGNFVYYDRRDGVVADGLAEAFFFTRCRDQEIFFGGRFGLTAFRPAQFNWNLHRPPLVVTDLRIEQELASASSTRGSNLKNVRVELAALDFMRPENNQYAYMLEGRDRDWIYQGTARVVRLAGLPIGRYVLRARAANNDGIWNEKAISIPIHVRLPFHERYMPALMAAAALAVLAAFVFWRRRRSRRLRQASIPDNLDRVLEKFSLSRREAEIVRLLLAGKSNKEIEDSLFIALATVKIHVHNIFQKVRVKNRLQLLLRLQREAKKLE